MDVEDAHLLHHLALVGVVVDHDEVDVRLDEVAGDLLPDAAEAADQVVVLQVLDPPLHAPHLQEAGHVTGDEQLDERDEQVEQRAKAERDQDDLGQLADDRLGLPQRAGRGDDVDGPVDPAPEAGALGG